MPSRAESAVMTAPKSADVGAPCETDWRWQFRHRLTSPEALAAAFGLTPAEAERCGRTMRVYPAAVTPYYASLCEPGNPADPVRRQCLPDDEELCDDRGQADPLNEDVCMPAPGLIQRYPDRCLLLVTSRCAVHCRHCNRKRFWGRGDTADLAPALDYIARHPAIREVILSGGDPLTLSDESLDRLLSALRAIPHVEVLRIGSRMPVVLPMRITEDLCRMLARHRPLWLNTQFNSAREITPAAAAACDRLLTSGIPVSNQSVLLKGVNDNSDAMRDLLYGLQRISVRPYYLFQCEPVLGTAHFRVAPWRGMAILEALGRGMSGLCLPRYVVDLPGRRGKTSLGHVPPRPGDVVPKP